MSDLNRYVLREAVSGADQDAYHSIRRSVLFDARGRTGYDENYPEETKPNNLRLLLLCDDQPVCAFRLDRAANNIGIIRLMAVSRDKQRKGHGTAALTLLAEVAISLKLDAIEVGAAADAVSFYQRNGFNLVDRVRESPLLRLNLR